MHSAFSGPLVVFGQSPYSAIEYNPELGPSMFYGGAGFLDPRLQFTYTPGQDFGQPICGFLGINDVITLNLSPVPLSNVSIAPLTTFVSASTPFTLVSANSASTGVGVGMGIVNSATGTQVNGLLGIDAYTSVSGYICNGTSGVAGNLLFVSTSTNVEPLVVGTVLSSANAGFASCTITGYGPATGVTASGIGFTGVYTVSGVAQAQGTSGSPITITGMIGGGAGVNSVAACRYPFGSAGSVQIWNPQALSARCVSITTASSSTGSATFTVNGYDVYGFPMTENIIVPTSTNGTVNGFKAFKYIASVTQSANNAVQNSVGTSVIFGLPFRSDTLADVEIAYSAASLSLTLPITANAGYVPAVALPATGSSIGAGQTTGDVRGTYALQSAPTAGTSRLVIRQSPLLYNIPSSQALFGVTQA